MGITNLKMWGYARMIRERLVKVEERLGGIDRKLDEVSADVKSLLAFREGFGGVSKALAISGTVAGIVALIVSWATK